MDLVRRLLMSPMSRKKNTNNGNKRLSMPICSSQTVSNVSLKSKKKDASPNRSNFSISLHQGSSSFHPSGESGTNQDLKYFGEPLEDIVMRENGKVPNLVIVASQFICEKGLQQEGLFRVNGNVRSIETLKMLIGKSGEVTLKSDLEVVTVASVLKLFIRQLPNSLVPQDMTELFLRLIASNPCPIERCYNELRQLCGKLPPCNYNTLKYLIQLLAIVARHEISNKMSPQALGIVFGPNIFRTNLRNQGTSNYIVTCFITGYDYIFKTEEEKFSFATKEISHPNIMRPAPCRPTKVDRSGSSSPKSRQRQPHKGKDKEIVYGSNAPDPSNTKLDSISKKHASPTYNRPLPPSPPSSPLRSRLNKGTVGDGNKSVSPVAVHLGSPLLRCKPPVSAIFKSNSNDFLGEQISRIITRNLFPSESEMNDDSDDDDEKNKCDDDDDDNSSDGTITEGLVPVIRKKQASNRASPPSPGKNQYNVKKKENDEFGKTMMLEVFFNHSPLRSWKKPSGPKNRRPPLKHNFKIPTVELSPESVRKPTETHDKSLSFIIDHIAKNKVKTVTCAKTLQSNSVTSQSFSRVRESSVKEKTKGHRELSSVNKPESPKHIDNKLTFVGGTILPVVTSLKNKDVNDWISQSQSRRSLVTSAVSPKLVSKDTFMDKKLKTSPLVIVKEPSLNRKNKVDVDTKSGPTFGRMTKSSGGNEQNVKIVHLSKIHSSTFDNWTVKQPSGKPTGENLNKNPTTRVAENNNNIRTTTLSTLAEDNLENNNSYRCNDSVDDDGGGVVKDENNHQGNDDGDSANSGWEERDHESEEMNSEPLQIQMSLDRLESHSSIETTGANNYIEQTLEKQRNKIQRTVTFSCFDNDCAPLDDDDNRICDKDVITDDFHCGQNFLAGPQGEVNNGTDNDFINHHYLESSETIIPPSDNDAFRPTRMSCHGFNNVMEYNKETTFARSAGSSSPIESQSLTVNLSKSDIEMEDTGGYSASFESPSFFSDGSCHKKTKGKRPTHEIQPASENLSMVEELDPFKYSLINTRQPDDNDDHLILENISTFDQQLQHPQHISSYGDCYYVDATCSNTNIRCRLSSLESNDDVYELPVKSRPQRKPLQLYKYSSSDSRKSLDQLIQDCTLELQGHKDCLRTMKESYKTKFNQKPSKFIRQLDNEMNQCESQIRRCHFQLKRLKMLKDGVTYGNEEVQFMKRTSTSCSPTLSPSMSQKSLHLDMNLQMIGGVDRGVVDGNEQQFSNISLMSLRELETQKQRVDMLRNQLFQHSDHHRHSPPGSPKISRTGNFSGGSSPVKLSRGVSSRDSYSHSARGTPKSLSPIIGSFARDGNISSESKQQPQQYLEQGQRQDVLGKQHSEHKSEEGKQQHTRNIWHQSPQLQTRSQHLFHERQLSSPRHHYGTNSPQQQQQQKYTRANYSAEELGSNLQDQRNTIESLEKELEQSRLADNRTLSISLMTKEELKREKIDIQKALLRFESTFGRPTTKSEKALVKSLYGRYSSVKKLLKNVDETPSFPLRSNKVPIKTKSLTSVASYKTTPFSFYYDDDDDGVSTENKNYRGSDVRPTEHCGGISGAGGRRHLVEELENSLTKFTLKQLVTERARIVDEKQTLSKDLKYFEKEFKRVHGREVQKDDKLTMQDEYRQLRELRAQLQLVESLINKRRVAEENTNE